MSRPCGRVIVALAVIGFLAAGALGATGKELRLEYQMTQVKESAPVGRIGSDGQVLEAPVYIEPKVKTTKDPRPVSLAENYLAVGEYGKTTIFDWSRRRIISVDPKLGQYEEHSLYLETGGREAEFRNRLMLGGAIAAAKVEQKNLGWKPFDLESLFGMEASQVGGQAAAEVAKAEITSETTSGVTTFSCSGRWVVRVTLSEQSLAGSAAAFMPFMAEEWNIHPQIRRQIAATGKVPAKIEFRYTDYPYAMITEIRGAGGWFGRSLSMRGHSEQKP